jgi:glycerol-3-phosphate acyltransferase PlsX
MIAVDVMSGENPPEEIIRGALKAVTDFNIKVAFVGDRELIEYCLKKLKVQSHRAIKIYHSSEVIQMHEIPTVACKKKKDASIIKCTQLVKEGKAHGLFSPGNTGATLVASFMNIGRLEGIIRPTLVTYIPTVKGSSLLIDAGANMDCAPEYLAQFAIMGEVFAKRVQKKKNPSVGLLSIGGEKSKGNELTLKTFELLKDLDFNFIGNIEGYDIFNGDIDVIVCDGFVGNIVLKVTERVFKLTFEFVWQEIGDHLLQRIGFALAYPAVRKLRKKTDPSEYGGAYLVGLNGDIVIGHGSSDATTAYNGVQMLNLIVKSRVNELIVERLEKFGLKKRLESRQN